MQTSFARGLAIAAGLAFISMFLLTTSTVVAHHGWGGNDDAEFEITGTVDSPLSLAGPHATMKIKADGKVWELTLASPSSTAAAGLKENTIPVGATVKAHGHRNQDKNKFEVKTERLTWNNKVFNVYPDRS